MEVSMNSRRLARLMGIVCDIKAHPRRNPVRMSHRLGVSRRQFYKDREALAKLGFAFHFSRKNSGFVLDKELTFNIKGLSLADLFAMILAVRQLTRLSDFGLAMGALAGLRTMVEQLPDEVQTVFTKALDQLVVADGFGCRPEVLYALQPAVSEGRRVVLVMGKEDAEERVSADPKRLFLKEGALYLESAGTQAHESNLMALSRVRKVIPTPFYSPQD